MTLDDIPADIMLSLTNELDRLFKAAHCNPACHACYQRIKVGEDFQLLSFDGRDQMVCHNCDRDKLEKIKQEKERVAALPPHRGYSRLNSND